MLEHRRRVIELDEAMHKLDAAHTALAAEKAKTEKLLTRILPETIANELKQNGRVEPRFHASASVIIADVKGWRPPGRSFSLMAEVRRLLLVPRTGPRFGSLCHEGRHDSDSIPNRADLKRAAEPSGEARGIRHSYGASGRVFFGAAVRPCSPRTA
ncbi:hypothetical protein MES5069_200049 [Mesorhizobium escarrei]|uniref:guanylate cyclase n=1 Tax=Mesorhizobium escarrei TaxID=666018 RepID=A0ABN8JK55_9HYPH|nr:hypothetical protein MES5069_200049 [Mesorhizobium escarrei]